MARAQKSRLFTLLLLLFLVCALLTVLAGPGHSYPPRQAVIYTNPVQPTEESVKTGEDIFLNYCAGCHGSRADGRGEQALNLSPKPQNLRNAPFVSYLSDHRIYTSIAGGVRGTSMPAFDLLIAAEKRWHVINYIRSLTADDRLNIPNSIARQQVAEDLKNPVPPAEESIASGRKLYMNYCANCHGPDADGAGVIAVNLSPVPRNLVVISSWGENPFIDYFSDARMYDSITNGVPGTSMLPWIGVFSDRQRWDIINYLRTQAGKRIEKIDFPVE